MHARLKILELSAWTRGDETFRASKLRAGKVPKEQAPAPLAGESEELVEELSVLGDLNTHTHTHSQGSMKPYNVLHLCCFFRDV